MAPPASPGQETSERIRDCRGAGDQERPGDSFQRVAGCWTAVWDIWFELRLLPVGRGASGDGGVEQLSVLQTNAPEHGGAQSHATVGIVDSRDCLS